MNTYTPLLKGIQLIRRVYAALLSPQQCILCSNVSSTALPLCPHCIENILNPYIQSAGTQDYHATRCRHCGKILISEQEYCTTCRKIQEKNELSPFFCTRIFALYPYIGLGQKIMPVWKNQHIRSFSAVFAPLFASFIMQQPELRSLPVVPVPPRAKKLRTKGWDQMQDISTYLSAFSKIKIYQCLKRTGTVAQKTLNKKERIQNIMNTITVTAKYIPEKVIVIDDVMTTGATFEACAKALIAQGCKKVYGVCLFFN